MIKITRLKYLIFALVIIVSVSLLYGCTRQEKLDLQSPEWINITIDIEKAKSTQEEVDNGHRVGLLDPHQVSYEFLETQLNIAGDKVQEMRDIKDTGNGKIIQVTLSDGKVLQLYLIQPVKKGSTGIWQVQKYRFVE